MIPEQVRLAAYRIAEEALTNVVKHTKASVVSMTLNRSPDEWLCLELRDNGQGFDLAGASEGRGLMMMQDYAAVVGGSCTDKERPGRRHRSHGAASPFSARRRASRESLALGMKANAPSSLASLS